MKGIGLIGLLLAMLIAGYLTMKRLEAPTARSADLKQATEEAGLQGKPIQKLPSAVRNSINKSMQKAAERQKEMLEGIE